VVERDRRCDVAGAQPVDERPVKVDARLVDGATAGGLDARPCDREAECAEAEAGDQVEVVFGAVIEVTGDVAGVAAAHLPRVWLNVSHTDVPRPSACTAPSIW